MQLLELSIISCLQIYHSSRINVDQDDELQWPMTKSKCYTVKSACDNLSLENGITQHNSMFTFIWNLKCPPKIGFFLWLIAHDRLPTTDLLRRRGIEVPATCVFCNCNESSAHLLLHCSFARDVWQNFLNKLQWFYCVHMDIIRRRGIQECLLLLKALSQKLLKKPLTVCSFGL